MKHSTGVEEAIGVFPAILPDQPFNASYEAGEQEHQVVIQWMGEGKGVVPAYYVFEGEEHTHQAEYPSISPEEWSSLTDEQLQKMYPDDKEPDPANATRVIEYIEDSGWTERGKGETEHSKAIGRLIEEHFTKAEA